MFGFVNNALENLILRTYGEEAWRNVLVQAGVKLEDHHFLQSFLYEDQDTFALIDAACFVLELNKDELMEQFGDQFFHWCEESGYDQLLRLLGRSLGEFLANLDALHDHLQLTYPGMQAPSFRIDRHPTDPESIYLHYYSVRNGLEHIVRGVILTLANSIFHLQVNIDIIEAAPTSQARYHACFAISSTDPSKGPIFESSLQEFMVTPAPENGSARAVSPGNDAYLTKSGFCQLFPFHIVFDRQMQIVQMGECTKRLLRINGTRSNPVSLPSVMIMERPGLNFTFETILRHIHTVFVLKMRHAARDGCAQVKFKGQMMYLPHMDCVIYMCSPRVRRLRELEECGLYLSDIPMHDATRDIVMTSESAMAHLAMVHKLEETTDELMYSKSALTLEKARSDALLHSILPEKVAIQILARQEVKPVWYKEVTILFSDIVGFTSICGKCTPIEVVAMLNELYTLFDHLTTVNKVYKVETIGDAYMVVGGLPEICSNHATRIANMAIDMMQATTKVKRPDNPDQSINIRIGFHSGEVMAGVVGKKTPRYCLFGDCVNIASRTESNGVEGRINLSNSAYEYLNHDQYMLEDRGDVAFKGRSDKMHCWFLNSHVERSPREVTLQQARLITSLMDNMADAEEMRKMPLSPPGSACTTPKTSIGEPPGEFNLAVGGLEVSTPATRTRKRSSIRAPPAGSLVTLPDQHEGPLEHMNGQSGAGQASACPIFQNRHDVEFRPNVPRRTSVGKDMGKTSRSVSDPIPPIPQAGWADYQMGKRTGSNISVSSMSSTGSGEQPFRSPSRRDTVPVSSTPQDIPRRASLSSLNKSSPVPTPEAASTPWTWLHWYASGTTAVCAGLLAYQIHAWTR